MSTGHFKIRIVRTTKKLRIVYFREFLISFGQESVVFLFAIRGLGFGSTKAKGVREYVTADHVCGILSSRVPRRTFSTAAPLWKSLNIQGIWA